MKRRSRPDTAACGSGGTCTCHRKSDRHWLPSRVCLASQSASLCHTSACTATTLSTQSFDNQRGSARGDSQRIPWCPATQDKLSLPPGGRGIPHARALSCPTRTKHCRHSSCSSQKCRSQQDTRVHYSGGSWTMQDTPYRLHPAAEIQSACKIACLHRMSSCTDCKYRKLSPCSLPDKERYRIDSLRFAQDTACHVRVSHVQLHVCV